jgi:hypothetical protein
VPRCPRKCLERSSASAVLQMQSGLTLGVIVTSGLCYGQRRQWSEVPKKRGARPGRVTAGSEANEAVEN